MRCCRPGGKVLIARLAPEQPGSRVSICLWCSSEGSPESGCVAEEGECVQAFEACIRDTLIPLDKYWRNFILRTE
jgi:hypothetical protein